MYGTQTIDIYSRQRDLFENDVEMYGTQTEHPRRDFRKSLRMM